MSPDFTKVKIAGPLTFAGPAVERDEKVPDRNDSPPADEERWLARAHDQHQAISASEVEFFQELRRRQDEG